MEDKIDLILYKLKDLQKNWPKLNQQSGPQGRTWV